MNLQIKKIKNLRLFLLSRIEELTTKQLNTIPAHFNNNIIWNLAHLISVQQSVCYMRSGLQIVVSEEQITPYMPGTKPDKLVDEDVIKRIKSDLIVSIDKMQEDYETNAFTVYTPSERIRQVYGIDVTNIDDAIDFILYHEGFHIGCIFMLKHLV